MTRRLALALAALALVALSASAALAKRPSSEPGQQVHSARWTDTAPVIDGVITPGEYAAAIPLNVRFDQPDQAPGITPGGGGKPNFPTPDNPNDLSFKAYIVYDADRLYVAVEVADDILIEDGPLDPWHDDDVEICIDGDGANNDMMVWMPGREGFQLLTSVGGAQQTMSNDPIDWVAATGPAPRGYLVEVAIALESIDTIDGPGTGTPGPGSSIGLNITVSDDDNGGAPYNRLLDENGWMIPNSLDVPAIDGYGAWDGNPLRWRVQDEASWGTLYLEPRPNGKARRGAAKPAGGTTWGTVKERSQ